MNNNYLIALDKIINDFKSLEINLYLALATDPENPHIAQTIHKINNIIVASYINFELLNLQEESYRFFINELRIEEVYRGISFITNSKEKYDIWELICLHRTIIDCRDLLNKSLELATN